MRCCSGLGPALLITITAQFWYPQHADGGRQIKVCEPHNLLPGRDGYLNKFWVFFKPKIMVIMQIILILIIPLFRLLRDPDLILNKKIILSPRECIEN